MKYTWKEYQQAKEIVFVFEKERSEIQSKRQFLRYNPIKRTYYSIIWNKREELNLEMYAMRKASKNQLQSVGVQFWNDWISKLKSDLFVIRKRSFLK